MSLFRRRLLMNKKSGADPMYITNINYSDMTMWRYGFYTATSTMYYSVYDGRICPVEDFEFINVKPSTTYTLNFPATQITDSNGTLRTIKMGIRFSNEGKTLIRSVANLQDGATITTPDNCTLVKIFLYSNDQGIMTLPLEQFIAYCNLHGWLMRITEV